MPRKPREEVEDGIHHVWARGNNRQPIYVDDADRQPYLSQLRRVVVRKRWRCLSYCLMDNHVHLLLETPDANLGSGMQRLHGDYAQLFNERHGRVGHVFQGRFGSKRDHRRRRSSATIVRYIARNPVEAGLLPQSARLALEQPSLPLVGGTAPPWVDVPRLHEYFGAMGGEPRAVYRELVDG